MLNSLVIFETFLFVSISERILKIFINLNDCLKVVTNTVYYIDWNEKDLKEMVLKSLFIYIKR